MFRDAAFHVVMCVLYSVVWIFCICGRGLVGICGGWEYSLMGSLCFIISVSSVSGKKGNLVFNISRFIF